MNTGRAKARLCPVDYDKLKMEGNRWKAGQGHPLAPTVYKTTNVETFNLTILGSSSPFPLKGRFTTSQVLQHNNKLYLIDCGEGTQIQLSNYGIKRNKIERIFISHLHGDHYYGIFGLLDSFYVLGRTAPLHIHCPSLLYDILKLTWQEMRFEDSNYPIYFHFTNGDKSEVIVDDKNIKISTIPLTHRVPTTGFLFEEKIKPRKMIGEKIKEYNIPYQKINGIKEGDDFVMPDGTVISNEELTLAPPKPKSYAFCSDTAYDESILPMIKGVDVLYHEATFEAALTDDAKRKGHATTVQAANIAKLAAAKRLVIGHFSTRYHHLEPLLAEARTVFENTELAVEGAVFEV